MELIALLNKHYDKLNENDLYTLRYILDHKKECYDISITQLAEKINMSPSSILRTTQKLGFSGYSEFKFALKKELENEMIHSPVNDGQNYFDLLNESINNTFKHFHNTDLKAIIDHIYNARNVFIYGTGWAQKLAGEQLVRLFFSCKRPMILVNHYTEFKSMLPNYSKDDFIIFISLSGNTEHIAESLRFLKVKEIPTLSITDFNNNQLATLATYNLYYQSTEIVKITKDSSVSLASSMASLQVLCELLYLKYVETIY